MVCIPVSYFFINSADLNDRAVLRLLLPYKRSHSGQPLSGILAGLDLHCCGDCKRVHWITHLYIIVTSRNQSCSSICNHQMT